jgi:ribonuclease HI
MIEIYTDGACFDMSKGSVGNVFIGIVIQQDKRVIKRIGKAMGKGFSTFAEYLAVREAVANIPEVFEREEMCLYCDNKSVVDKISLYSSEKINIEALEILELGNKILADIIKFTRGFKGLAVKWLDRNQNFMANELAQNASKGIIEEMIDGSFMQKRYQNKASGKTS